MGPLTLQPIGTIATPYDQRYRAPRQPGAARASAEGLITLNAGMNFEQALADLEGFERIWVLYWFDRNSAWRPKVLPPRGPRVRRGVFATRSPHRPNPIGLSLVRLIAVSGRTLRVADVDLLDGTPILDIKPYLPYAEAFPDAGMGWLQDVVDDGLELDVSWSELASEQSQWLRDEHGVDIAAHAEAVLSADPESHPYRRTSERDDGTMELAIQSWRVVYQSDPTRVQILRIESGYSSAIVDATDDRSLHDHEAHRAFHARWPRDGA